MRTKHRPLTSLDKILSVLNYCPRSGEFTWRVQRSYKAAGSSAGSITSNGYLCLRIEGRLYYAHRVAYYIITGKDPGEMEIDHKDHNPLNNKKNNLRLAKPYHNSWNMEKHKDNTSGHKGVFWSKKAKVWVGQITVKGVRYCIPGSPSLSVVVGLVQEIREKLHPKFYYHG